MERKTKIKRAIGIFGIVIACMLVIILTAFTVHCITVSNYNQKDRTLRNASTVEDEISIKIAKSSSWEKNDEVLGTDTYNGIIYESTITNLSQNSLETWTATFNIKEDCYINQAWCGSVEVHQFRDGVEKVKKIIDLRSATEELEDSELDYIIDSSSTWLISLKEGDYIVYYPDSDKGGEYPLESQKDATIGMILYAKGTDIDLSNCTVNYKLKESYFEGTVATIYIGLFIVWCVGLLCYISISIIITQYEKRLASKEKVIQEVFDVFSNFVDAKDPYTHGHSERVAEYSEKIAEKLGMKKEECKNVYRIATLHDIGKCYVPDEILNKPSRLTDEEFEKIKQHTTKGAEMVKNFSSIPHISDGALYHHERYDGKGYPTGKSGQDIPLIGRIICVADAFDAMNSNRIYRKKLSKDTIIQELINGKGTQFDPNIVDAFIEILDSEKYLTTDTDSINEVK